MEKKPETKNVIPFPEERIQRSIPVKNDLFADFPAQDEWLDIEDELWAKEDFEKLITLHLEQLGKYPKDHFARFSLAQAYFFNYEYEKALENLHEIHKKLPEDPDILYFVFEVLVASGKNEEDFDWVTRPEITNLTKETLDVCYNVLKPGHKSCSVDDLYKLFSDKGYLMFTQDHLLAALIKDDRFSVKNPDSLARARIHVMN